MAKFNIDGLIYTDKLPHSRIERILYSILKKEGGGGDEPSEDVEIGFGLKVVGGNTLALDTVDEMDTASKKPITSNAIYKELEKADAIMARI